MHYSSDMARSKTISHQLPSVQNASLTDRFKNAGIELTNVAIAENLAVDYILAISWIVKDPEMARAGMEPGSGAWFQHLSEYAIKK